ncbi:uncharacterized protein LAESUDRAFT_760108 [Laetiporus sulphureus 93-53]|uniref:Uncharacterized protein n=1 Tax=Laetiporus sulphureus 93-53 TaxID=1314785 RepID=A0A165DSQ9_9APHY|nr:uncharacterized protein LAESUDRAFT_760108 [Laetiporus sulphureus 93-53]KZT05552.1 hypothetical protein LAESUDRAFT_760108 [Laetiporus sulphureus 93-53]
MSATSPRRGHHRKRLSALRLSTDSTVTTLPAYTRSPPWTNQNDLLGVGDISDRPPEYPDSADEGDEDTDTDESQVVYLPPSPLLPSSTRRARFSQPSRTRRRQSSSAGDPYLDSLLARSVHALEMSNALLQSSMSTQSSLSAVLASDSMADRSLEARAQVLTSRIRGNRDLHETWLEDLDEISKSVDDLVGGAGEDSAKTVEGGNTMSKSLPSSGLAADLKPSRRPSLELRHVSGSQLQYSNHDRSHFVSPPPRALTMYVDSSGDPNLIVLPPTLGQRTTSHLPPTPLPSSETLSEPAQEALSEPADQTRRIVDVLSSFVGIASSRQRSGTASASASISSSPQLSSSISTRTGRSSSTSSRTIRQGRHSKSPPAKPASSPPIASGSRSRSLTPMRQSSSPRMPRPMTPPIEELSSSSASSESDTLHVDRTLESLRSILERQPPRELSPRPPRPSFLQPSTVSPVSGTSNATASISRLFTKGRHSSSTRPPSPPRQSVLKNRSAPPTPINDVSHTSTLLDVPDMLSISGLFNGSIRSGTSSGRSTPKRISFAELPEPYSTKSRERRKGNGKDGKDSAKRKGKEREKDEGTGWWTGWLLGAAGTGSGSGLSLAAVREERTRGSPWTSRPVWEEWGA